MKKSLYGVDRYEIVATLDNRTSELCQSLDGEVFKTSEYEVGVTAPPFHPYCRTTTCPYFDDEFTADEMRAARGEDGQYYTVPSNMKYSEWKEMFVEKNAVENIDFIQANGIMSSGAVSGALNPFDAKAEEHAIRYYALVRKMSTDVSHISKNTGIPEKTIEEIKQFIFIEKHDLGGAQLEYFAPDYMMAETWRRLIEGEYEPHDITLLKHEIMERELMRKGMTQAEAHYETSKKYNYQKEAEAYYAKIERNKNK